MEPYSGHTPKFPHHILSELPNTGLEVLGGVTVGDLVVFLVAVFVVGFLLVKFAK